MTERNMTQTMRSISFKAGLYGKLVNLTFKQIIKKYL